MDIDETILDAAQRIINNDDTHADGVLVAEFVIGLAELKRCQIDFDFKSSRGQHLYYKSTLIIVDEAGPLHSNQTSGNSCSQHEVRGYAHDLSFMSNRDLDIISPCLCNCRVDKEEIESIFANYGVIAKVDEGWQSEAWIGLKVKHKGKWLEAVLTYNNCD